jgi:predicted extracellular nuclease
MSTLKIAWYNLENLFEPLQHPELKEEWTPEHYKNKVKNLASVISELHDPLGPDLLGICEVQSESEEVIQDILNELPNGNEYAIVHHRSKDIRKIDVGFIYRKSVLSDPKPVAYNVRKRYPTRDILVVTFQVTNGSTLHVIGNHWPSRTGGQYESEPFRIMVAENCAWIVDQFYQSNANTNIIVMGDFNDEPFNRSIQEYLFAIRNRDRVQARKNSSKSRPYLYNLTWSLMDETTPGTYYYSKNPAGWNMLDQIMVSKGILAGNNGLEVDEKSIKIFRPKRIKDGSKPKPYRKRKNKWVKGFSDHFPVTALIKIF